MSRGLDRVARRIAVVLAALASPAAFADTGFLDRTLALHGQDYRYQVYVPRDWTPARKWPVLIELHANGSQGADGLSQTRHSALLFEMRKDRSRFPAIVVWPQAREGTRFSTPAMQEMVLAQLDRALAEFSGDPARVYLTGFSMGGAGSIRMASKWPDRFAAVVDMSGAVSANALSHDKAQVAEDVGAHAYLQSADEFASAAQLIRSLPVWVFHGEADTIVAVEESRRLVAALKAAGASVRYTEYPGEGHGQVPPRAWADQGFVEWLFSQRREN